MKIAFTEAEVVDSIQQVGLSGAVFPRNEIKGAAKTKANGSEILDVSD